MSTNPIAVPLDVSSAAEALRLVDLLKGHVGMFKVGSQLYMAAGPAIVDEITGRGERVFLDLKFHDIPNTVAEACAEAAKRKVSMLTVHAAGGRRMIETAMRRLQEEFGAARPQVVAVTMLTSLGDNDLQDLGIGRSMRAQVVELARLAERAGADGVVCSPHEIGDLRRALKPGSLVVTPGIRLPGGETHDQTRFATAAEALEAGANLLVIGRPITAAADPVAAIQALGIDHRLL